jgi:hypothetical protein
MVTLLKNRFVGRVFVLKVTLNTTQENNFVFSVSKFLYTTKNVRLGATGFVVTQHIFGDDETISEMR